MDNVAEAITEGAKVAADHSLLRSPDEFTHEDWMDALELHYEGEPWPEQQWGPPPGQPGCRVPTEVLAKFEHIGDLAPPGIRGDSDRERDVAHGLIISIFGDRKEPWAARLIAKAEDEAWGDTALLTILRALPPMDLG